jgi:Dna[CI] antecedent, DciA
MAARKSSAWIPTRPDPRGAAPARIGELLVGAEAFMAQKTGAAIPREEWRALVGPRIANRTRVGRLYRGVLTIYVATSAWGSELSFLKDELIAKLQNSSRTISNLKFVVEQLQPERHRRAPSLPDQHSLPELPDELIARLQLVEDPNLRAAIASAARHSLGRSKV